MEETGERPLTYNGSMWRRQGRGDIFVNVALREEPWTGGRVGSQSASRRRNTRYGLTNRKLREGSGWQGAPGNQDPLQIEEE